jgi:sulfide dehydrogenase [flavocytochrome c] flavoprotein chain
MGQARPRVVVVGGGSGGATAARYIAMGADGAIDVVLVEPARQYYTCYFSNLYLGGFWDFDDLGHDYGTLAARHGINVVHDWAVGVDRDARTVTLGAATCWTTTGWCCRRASTSSTAACRAGT